MIILFLAIFSGTVALSGILTLAVKYISEKMNIMDNPGTEERKKHEKATPLMGGFAIFLAFFIVLFFFTPLIISGNLNPSHWLGFFFGALILMIGGFFDDKFKIKPGVQFIFPLLATVCVVAGGVGIEKITNPLGGYLYLDQLKIFLFNFHGPHYFVIISDLIVVLWLLGMMYTTKLLDGVDGLVSGISAIGGLIIFLFTMTTKYFQPDVGLAALIFSAACVGFLIFNFNPAKIFLGEGGSLFLGYVLGVLAVISGGKIAIALLIMGIPILDTAWTIIRRIYHGKNPFKFADRLHLHFLLLDSGLGQRKTVLLYYGLAAVFGLSGLFLQSKGKVFALGILFLIMVALVAALNRSGVIEWIRGRK